MSSLCQQAFYELIEGPGGAALPMEVEGLGEAKMLRCFF